MASTIEMVVETPVLGITPNIEGLVESVLQNGVEIQNNTASEFLS